MELMKTKPKRARASFLIFFFRGTQLSSRVMCPGSFLCHGAFYRIGREDKQDLKKDAGCAAPGNNDSFRGARSALYLFAHAQGRGGGVPGYSALAGQTARALRSSDGGRGHPGMFKGAQA